MCFCAKISVALFPMEAIPTEGRKSITVMNIDELWKRAPNVINRKNFRHFGQKTFFFIRVKSLYGFTKIYISFLRWLSIHIGEKTVWSEKIKVSVNIDA